MGLLETYLQEHNPRLWRALGNVRQAAGEIWKVPLHRYYTDHTVTHSERIIEKLDGLTAGAMGRGTLLSPSEVYVLLTAAYLHDIGMQNERFDGGNLEEIRAQHHELTAEMIEGSIGQPVKYRYLGLDPDPTLVHLVALVAKAHRRVDLFTPEYEPTLHGKDEIRPLLLGALLRFVDELDIDHRRIILENLKILQPDMETYFHWYKCYYVGGVAVREEYVKIYYRFPEADYGPLIQPLVEDQVREKFRLVEDILRDGDIRASIGPSVSQIMRMEPMPPDLLAYVQGKLKGQARAKPGAVKSLDPTSSRPSSGSTPIDRVAYLRQLERDLERVRELLEATESRLHELRKKRQLLGPSAFPAGQAAELRQAEEEVRDLKEEIRCLEAQIQSEGN